MVIILLRYGQDLSNKKLIYKYLIDIIIIKMRIAQAQKNEVGIISIKAQYAPLQLLYLIHKV